MKKNSPSLNKSFTFVELLMTAGTVAVFSVMLMAVVGKAHADAVEASCKGNQKQIMAAALAYANDYQGFMAPANYNSMNWDFYLKGYVRVAKGTKAGKKSYIPVKSNILYCPDEPIVKNISYGVSSSFKNKQDAWGVSIEQMNPSLIYLADINQNWRKITSTPSFIPRRASINGNKWGDIMLRHDDDTANVGKIDGSVENLSEKILKSNNQYWTVKK